MHDLRDISAVLLTIGENTFPEALVHVNQQTYPPVDVILVKNVSPFHKALNIGTSKVKTKYFVQVDADMLLDDDCFERLRAEMADNVGIVAGHLRDTLRGMVIGVKMFRTACFQIQDFQDTISPDTDFRAMIKTQGWQTVVAGKITSNKNLEWETYGLHQREYSPEYTFRKFLIEGLRLYYRNHPDSLRWHLTELRKSSHQCSLIAQIGLCHGVFLNEERDLLQPYEDVPLDDVFKSLQNFMTETKSSGIDNKYSPLINTIDLGPDADLPDIYCGYYHIGRVLRSQGSFSDFENLIDRIWKNNQRFSWIAIVGICNGIFELVEDHNKLKNDMEIFTRFVQILQKKPFSGFRKVLWKINRSFSMFFGKHDD